MRARESANDGTEPVLASAQSAQERQSRTAVAGPPVQFLRLQQAIGNRAITTLIKAARASNKVPFPTVQRLSQVSAPATSSAPETEVSLPSEIAAVAAGPGDLSKPSSDMAGGPLARLNEAERQAQDQLAAGATAKRAAVEAFFSGPEQELAAAFGSFQKNARSGAAAEESQVRSVGRTTAAGIQEQAKSSEAAAKSSIAEIETAAVMTGEREAGRARSGASIRAKHAKPSASGASDEEVRQGKERIAATVSGRADTEMNKAGSQTAASVKSGVQHLQSNLYGPAQADVAGKVAASADQANRALLGGTSVAATAVNHVTDRALSQSGKAERTVREAVRTGRRQALSDVEQWESAGRTRIAAVANEYRRAIDASARHFEAAVESTTAPAKEIDAVRAETDAAFRQGTDEAVAALNDTASGLLSGLSELVSQHADVVARSGESVQQKLEQVADFTRAAQRQATGAFISTASTASAHAAAEFAAAPGKVSNALAEPHRTGVTALSSKVDEAATQEERWADEARSAGERGSSRLESQAASLAREAQSQDRAPVQGFFESIFGPMRTWLRENLGNVLGGIVSGIIQALPAIAIAVALLFAGPVGWGVLAALFVVGAGLGIYSRFKEFEADHGGQGPSFWQGVGLVALGVADITGIPYIVEAAVGQRAFSPHPMSEFECWERGTEGVIFLLLMGLGGAKKLFGKGRAGVPVTEPKPEVKGPKPGETPREPVTPHEVPVDPHTVEIRGGTNHEKFQFVKQEILRAPPGQRAQTARILFERLRSETGHTWGAAEHSATNGTYWTGEGAPFIFFIDSAGNVFQGRVGPTTFSYGPGGQVTVNVDSFKPPSPPPAPPVQAPSPPPAQPPGVEVPTTAPGMRPGLPIPVDNEREGASK